MIPVIALGFALLAGLLLWFVIGSRGRWWVKLSAIVVTCAFTFAVWDALDSFTGWPSTQSPPSRALLVSSTVDEPDAIYLWLIPSPKSGLLGYRPDEVEPRAYRLPYTREQHEQVDRANGLARKGQQVELRRAPRREGSGRDARSLFRAYRLPSPALPRKDQE